MASPPSRTTGAAIRQLFVDFAAPHKVLTKGETLVVRRLCSVLKRHLYHIAAAAVRAAAHAPVLYTYQADGTPCLSMATVVQQVTDARRVVRRAGSAMEFLIERGYIKSFAADGTVSIACLMRDPRPMSAGKSTWCIYDAAASFFPGLRALDHRGPCISHFAFDRAVRGAVVRKLRQRQALMYSTQGPDTARNFLRLLDWIIDTG